MADTPVYHDSALSRRMAEIARLNMQHGSRREGGGAPIVPADPAPAAPSSATVLPPAPTEVESSPGALSAEEERLLAEWEAERAAAAPKTAPTLPEVAARRPTVVPTGRVSLPAGFAGFSHIDLTGDGAVVTDTGLTFPIHPDELVQVKRFAFEVSLRALNMNMQILARNIGINLAPPAPPAEEEGKDGGPAEAVPTVPGGEAVDGVSETK